MSEMLKIKYKRVIIYFFVIVIVLLQFRMATKQGYVLLSMEIAIAFLFSIWNGRVKVYWNEKKVLFIWNLFLIYILGVSVLIDGIRISAYQSILYKCAGMTIMAYYVAMYINHEETLKNVRNAGGVLSLLGVVECVTKQSLFLQFITVESRQYMVAQLGTSAARVRLIFIQPIICAVFMVFFWLCLLYRPFKSNILNLVFGLSIIISILGTQSRSSWIAFVCVTLFALKKKIKTFRFKKSDFYSGVILLILCIVIICFNFEKLHAVLNFWWMRWITGLNITNASNYNRVTMIRNGLNDWMRSGLIQKLFGGGATYAIDYLKNYTIRGWNTAVDNQYLTILMNFGLVGEVLFLYLAYKIATITLKAKNSKIEFWGLTCISMLISTFFYEMLSWTMITMLFTLSVCMLEKEIRQANGFALCGGTCCLYNKDKDGRYNVKQKNNN